MGWEAVLTWRNTVQVPTEAAAFWGVPISFLKLCLLLDLVSFDLFLLFASVSWVSPTSASAFLSPWFLYHNSSAEVLFLWVTLSCVHGHTLGLEHPEIPAAG